MQEFLCLEIDPTRRALEYHNNSLSHDVKISQDVVARMVVRAHAYPRETTRFKAIRNVLSFLRAIMPSHRSRAACMMLKLL